MAQAQKLVLTTRELNTDDFKLLAHLPENPLAFVRGGDGIVGWGEAVRLESSLAAGRVADLAAKWRELVASASVTDEVQLPGTGLVAFGTFAFPI